MVDLQTTSTAVWIISLVCRLEFAERSDTGHVGERLIAYRGVVTCRTAYSDGARLV